MNVIVGDNNSGKSTIFEGLNFLRHFHTNGLGMNLSFSDQKQDFIKLVNNHDEKKTITINLTLKEFPNIVFNLFLKKNLEHSFKCTVKNSQKIVSFDNVKDYEKYYTIIKDIMYISPVRANIQFSSVVDDPKLTMQALSPDCNNINQFIINNFTSQHKYWNVFEKWLKKVDPNIISFKSRLDNGVIFLETDRICEESDMLDNESSVTVSINFQGSGIQNIIQIMAAVFFSKGEIVIIEEPEVFLHPKSVEILVDLFNYAINNMGKQIIITTHSMEVINAYCSDVGEGTKRGEQHEKIKPEDFTLYIINDDPSKPKIEEYNLVGKKYSDVRSDFKELWG